LKKSDNEKFLFVINSENHSVTVDVGVNVPEGDYSLMQGDLKEVRNVYISDKYVLNKQDLSKFRVNLERGSNYTLCLPSRHGLESGIRDDFFWTLGTDQDDHQCKRFEGDCREFIFWVMTDCDQ
jgi:hypothetical protein